MKRNCYLDSSSHKSMNEKLNVNKKLVANPHNGNHKFDEKELQARAIIWLASQEIMEGKNGSNKESIPTLSLSMQPSALQMHASHGFSIKRSLHNFLEKRKKRIQSHHVSIVTHDNDNNSSTN
ncbi:putative transcription regulator Others family [Medicago truncatula]|nr:uncharacterized protein LOC25489623 [Medicago truncatula]RHN69008.1 putative transcription regulator Others family [Medicago truncatula]